MKILVFYSCIAFIFLSCQPESVLPKYSNVDYDGNVYRTVEIGKQTWMAENLKTTHLNDGTPILMKEDWSGLTKPAYCWYNNDSVKYKEIYGPLYNAYAVNTGKLCPLGWHVPTKNELDVLIAFLGGAEVAGGKLKSTSVWGSPNTGATDEFNFKALPGGARDQNTNFGQIGVTGYFWSSSTIDGTKNWSFYVKNTTVNMNFFAYPFIDAFSVRCIKD